MSDNTEPWGYVRYTRMLFTKGGKYQWRWLAPYPPESPDGIASPVFENELDAHKWCFSSGGITRITTFDGWNAVEP